MRYSFYLLFFIGIGLLLLSNCASISQPTGGPKDTIPPVLELSIPINGSLNYRGTTFQLKFDEYVKVDKLRQELIITPKYDGNVKAKVNRNTIALELDKKLDDSTTYTFTFREGIKDITESNAPVNLSLAFSTGDYIDSIFIEGKVNDLMTNKEMEDILVGLYPIDDTVFLFDGAPTYFTKTDEEGYFRINNIKVDRYLITANQDENSNLINDSDKESYGYLSDTLNLDVSLSDLSIKLLRLDVRPIRLLNSRPSGKYFEAKYNKHIKEYVINTEDSMITNLVEDGKTIRFYPNLMTLDSLELIIDVSDSVGLQSTDTLMVKFEETKRDFDKFNLSISLEENSKLNENIEFTFSFNKPIEKLNLDSIFFQYDSTHVFPLDSNHLVWNKNKDLVNVRIKLDSTLYFDLKQVKDTTTILEDNPEQVRRKTRSAGSSGFKFVAGPGTFISVDNDTSRLVIRNVTFKKRDLLGSISGTITTKYKSYTVQLVDKKFNVKAELINPVNYSFKEIDPGKYFIRVLIDTNENGIWEKGNILKGLEPEDIYFYEKELPVRANWEINGEDFSF